MFAANAQINYVSSCMTGQKKYLGATYVYKFLNKYELKRHFD